MPGLNTDLLRKAAPLFATQLSGSISPSDTTIPLQSISGLPLDTAVTITIDATDANGNQTPTFKETITGVVNTGSSSLINCLRGLDTTTAQAHSTGATVVQWFTATDWNDFISSFLTEHVQLGHHQALSDVNGKTWLGQSAASNSVNYLTLGNAATGVSPSLVASGTDSNIPITLTPKGTGPIVVPNGTISTLSATNPHKFSVYRNSAWFVGNGTFSKVDFDTKTFDTGSDFDNSTNFRFVAPVAGFYQFNATASFTLGANNIGTIALYKNGSIFKQGNESLQGSSTTGFTGVVSDFVQLAVSDYVEVFAYGNGGSGTTGSGATYFSGFLQCVT